MKIADIKLLDKGALIASFTLVMDNGISIREMKLFEKGGRSWVAGPSRGYTINGENKWFNYLQLPDSIANQVHDLITAELDGKRPVAVSSPVRPQPDRLCGSGSIKPFDDDVPF